MNNQELEIIEGAYKWVKEHKTEIINKFADPKEFPVSLRPVSLFMAGSPGAGKTETSKRLIEKFKDKPVRIDADEIRLLCPGYTGENAVLFQKAATKGVQVLYDYVLEKKQNVILDGTFAYGNAIQNIERSLERGRKAEIWFIFHDPKTAWEFTKHREEKERRRVTKEVFINALFQSQSNVNEAKEKFGTRIELNLIVKNFDTGLENLELNINKLDPFLGKLYTRDELNQLLA